MTECDITSLDLTSLPEKETSIANNFYVKIPCTAGLPTDWTQDLSLVFDLGKYPYWIDTTQLALRLTVQVQLIDGTELKQVCSITGRRKALQGRWATALTGCKVAKLLNDFCTIGRPHGNNHWVFKHRIQKC